MPSNDRNEANAETATASHDEDNNETSMSMDELIYGAV